LLGDWFASWRGAPHHGHDHSEGYRASEFGSTLNDEVLELTLQRHFGESDSQISRVQVAHLDSIVSFTQERGIALAVVNTPLHPRYAAAVPSTSRATLDSIWSELASVPGLQLFDLSTTTLADSLFRDFDHVNARGARRAGVLLTGVEGAN